MNVGYLPYMLFIWICLFWRAMLLLMALLLSEPSLDWLRCESSSLRIDAPDSAVIVWSTPLDWAMLASLNPVSAISRLMSSAMSGECDLTLVCSAFALAVEAGKEKWADYDADVLARIYYGDGPSQPQRMGAQSRTQAANFWCWSRLSFLLTFLPGVSRVDARRSRASLLAKHLGYVLGVYVLRKVLHDAGIFFERSSKCNYLYVVYQFKLIQMMLEGVFWKKEIKQNETWG